MRDDPAHARDGSLLHLLVDVGSLQAYKAALVDGGHVVAESLGLVQDLILGARVIDRFPSSKSKNITFVLSIGRSTVTRVSRTSNASEEIL